MTIYFRYNVKYCFLVELEEHLMVNRLRILSGRA